MKAQNIQFKIVDEHQKPIEFANGTLKRNNGQIIQNYISDPFGFLKFTLPNEECFLECSYLGFEKVILSFQDLKAIQSENEYTLRLKPTEAMGDIVVKEQKVLYQQEAGKTIVDVAASPGNTGLMALDVLRKIPGVQVDQDGSISIKGKSEVQVVIDGKTSYLNSKQIASLLKSVPAAQLSTIEVQTVGDATNDAKGSGGILTINFKQGFPNQSGGNLHSSVGYGFHHKSNLGFFYSKGNRKGSHSIMYDYINNGDMNQFLQTRNFGAVSSGRTYTIDQLYKVQHIDHSVRWSSDFYWHPKHSTKWSLWSQFSNDENKGSNAAWVRNNAQILEQNLLTTDQNPASFTTVVANFDHNFKFDSIGSKLNFGVQYNFFNQSSRQVVETFFRNTQQQPISYLQLNSQMPTRVHNFAMQIDLKRNFGKVYWLEAGLKQQWIGVESNALYDQKAVFTNPYPIKPQNIFLYEEQITAGYVNSRISKGKWKSNVGLRSEYWFMKGASRGDSNLFYRTYLQPFPSVQTTFQIDSTQSISMAYNRRIDRPAYEMLNPLTYFSDPYTLFAGNILLRPQFNHHFELAHSLWEGALVSTLNYDYTNDYFWSYALVPTLQNEEVQNMATINIEGFRNYGASISLYVPVFSWLTSQFYVNVFKNEFRGDGTGFSFSTSRWSAIASTNHTIKLPKKYDFEISGQYIAPSKEGFASYAAMGMLSLAVQKSYLGGRLSCKLAVQDVAYQFIYKSETNTEFSVSQYSYRWDNRFVTFGITWKLPGIGSSEVQEERPKTIKGRRM